MARSGNTTAPPTIVVADDNEAARVLLEVLLEVGGAGRILATAADGREAVDAVVEHAPDVALLDVDMPRLRGTDAAAFIRTYRPQTQVILHTAQPDDAVRREAEALGVPLLDKMGSGDGLNDLLAGAYGDGGAARPIEAAVLLALERRPGEAVVVADATGQVLFYCHLAAEILGLPFPCRPLPLADFSSTVESLEPLESRPLHRALQTRAPAAGVVHERRGGDVLTIESRALPLYTPDAAFVGVAAYWRVVDGV